MWHNQIKKECPDPFADKVKCEECKCWLDRTDAQEVKYESLYSYTQFFCETHKKPFTLVHAYTMPVGYYGEVRMDEDGTPVGYVKEPMCGISVPLEKKRGRPKGSKNKK